MSNEAHGVDLPNRTAQAALTIRHEFPVANPFR